MGQKFLVAVELYGELELEATSQEDAMSRVEQHILNTLSSLESILGFELTAELFEMEDEDELVEEGS